MAPTKELLERIGVLVEEMDSETAARSLLQDEEKEDFYEQLKILNRMDKDEMFRNAVVDRLTELRKQQD